MAILCINRLDLPPEILTIIKDYSFISREKKEIMHKFKQTHQLINGAVTYSNFGCHSKKVSYIWFSVNDYYYFNLCKQCGNYARVQAKIGCRC